MSTGHDKFLEEFKQLCQDSHRLFLPEKGDETVAITLYDFHINEYSYEVLYDTAKAYINASPKIATITLHNFALRCGEFREKVAAEHESQNKIQEIMQQTKTRMEGLK